MYVASVITLNNIQLTNYMIENNYSRVGSKLKFSLIEYDKIKKKLRMHFSAIFFLLSKLRQYICI